MRPRTIAVIAGMIFSAAALAQQGALRPGDPNPYATRAGDPNPYATRGGDPNPYATRAGDANTLPAQRSQGDKRHRPYRERKVRSARDPNSEHPHHGTGAR